MEGMVLFCFNCLPKSGETINYDMTHFTEVGGRIYEDRYYMVEEYLKSICQLFFLYKCLRWVKNVNNQMKIKLIRNKKLKKQLHSYFLEAPHFEFFFFFEKNLIIHFSIRDTLYSHLICVKEVQIPFSREQLKKFFLGYFPISKRKYNEHSFYLNYTDLLNSLALY